MSDQRAENLRRLAGEKEIECHVVKAGGVAATDADAVFGPGAWALQKLFPPGDDRPPSCEPPLPKPLRIPSLHAR